MSYTVQEVATLAGVSVRTLHYYDEIGLLNPTSVAENGYRQYEDAELARLQQILFFRELDFPLEKIKEIMDAPGFDALSALCEQQSLLEVKRDRIDRLLTTITKTISSMKGGETMSNDDTFSAFSDPTYQKYKDEAEQRWGNSYAYKQSIERVGKMTKSEMEAVRTEGEAISATAAQLMKQGCSPESDEVQEQVGKFYNHLRHFYDPSPEMFKGLGQMYVDDSRFTETYEKRAEGFAKFMRDAMAFYADQMQK